MTRRLKLLPPAVQVKYLLCLDLSNDGVVVTRSLSFKEKERLPEASSEPGSPSKGLNTPRLRTIPVMLFTRPVPPVSPRAY